jgi:hypothetical protein
LDLKFNDHFCIFFIFTRNHVSLANFELEMSFNLDNDNLF